MDFRTRQAGDLVPVSGLVMVAGAILGLGMLIGASIVYVVAR